MSFEAELSALIAAAGLPAPYVGESRETAWPRIISAFGLLSAVAEAARSVTLEPGVADQLRCYVQGCKLLYALEALEP